MTDGGAPSGLLQNRQQGASNPGKGPGILTWANSGIGGQCDIGNNKTT